MPPGSTHQHPKPMMAVSRPVGQNDVGMIAWTLTLKTPECPQGRKVRSSSRWLDDNLCNSSWAFHLAWTLVF